MWPQWEDWVSLSAETLDEFTPLCFDYQVFHSVHPHCAGTERCQMCEILCDGIGNLEKTERSVARGEGISFHRIYESPFFFLRIKDAWILSTNIRVSIRILLHDIQRGCMSFTCWRNEFVHWYSWGKKRRKNVFQWSRVVAGRKHDSLLHNDMPARPPPEPCSRSVAGCDISLCCFIIERSTTDSWFLYYTSLKTDFVELY